MYYFLVVIIRLIILFLFFRYRTICYTRELLRFCIAAYLSGVVSFFEKIEYSHNSIGDNSK